MTVIARIEPKRWGWQDDDDRQPWWGAGKRGRRILLVDNDPQSSLTQGLLGPELTAALPAESTIAAVYGGDVADPSKSSARPISRA